MRSFLKLAAIMSTVKCTLSGKEGTCTQRTHVHCFYFAFAVMLLISVFITSASDIPGAPPILGCNTYDHVGCCPNEALVKSVAHAMLAHGMQQLGYTYINIDCGWANKSCTEAGEVSWDSDLFPSGIPSLASYLHDRGFKLGIYSDRGKGMFHGKSHLGARACDLIDIVS